MLHLDLGGLGDFVVDGFFVALILRLAVRSGGVLLGRRIRNVVGDRDRIVLLLLLAVVVFLHGLRGADDLAIGIEVLSIGGDLVEVEIGVDLGADLVGAEGLGQQVFDRPGEAHLIRAPHVFHAGIVLAVLAV